MGRGGWTLINGEGGFFLRFYKWVGKGVSNKGVGMNTFADFTVTDLANSCATPLFRRPQGSQGCLEKQNHPLSLKLVVWCAKIEHKTKKD